MKSNLQLLPLDEEPAKARLIRPAGSGYDSAPMPILYRLAH